jgi:acid stress-induced BolA-like protein IbaG/YrbA
MIPKGRNYRQIDVEQSNRIAKGMKEQAGMSARRVSGSGSHWMAKGDVYSEMFLFEGKDKAKPSKQRTVYREIFDKIALEALGEGKMPVYAIGFGDGDDFMILKDAHFYAIIDRMLTAEAELMELKGESE